jgi:hypothetical protein
MKEHALHYVVITGYDEDEGYFELFDKYKLSGSDFEGRLAIEEVNMARRSENPLRNAVMGDYTRPIMNIWAEVDVPETFSYSDSKCKNILLESYERMYGQKKILGHECGLGALDKFIKDLLAKKQYQLDEKSLYLFKTYYNESFKVLSRNRRRFKVFIEEISALLTERTASEIAGLLEESAKHWDIAANLALKLGIVKSTALIDDIVKHLEAVKQAEENLKESLRVFLGINY